MKVKLRKDMYIPTFTERFTCMGCVFLSNNEAVCQAPDCIYTSCRMRNQLFHKSQEFFKIFDL